MELDAWRPSCLRHRPSGLSFCLSAPRHCTRRSPFSNGNGTGTCWGPSAGPTLFLRGEFLDSRAAFVKFSSVGTQNYFFWLNNFIASASPHWKRRLFLGPPRPLGAALRNPKRPVSACLSTQDGDDQKPELRSEGGSWSPAPLHTSTTHGISYWLLRDRVEAKNSSLRGVSSSFSISVSSTSRTFHTQW